MICMDRADMLKLFHSKKIELIEEMQLKGYTVKELANNSEKMNQIVDIVVDRGLRDNAEVEIFIALFSILNFYPAESKVCFVLNNDFNLSKDIIHTLKDLKDAIKEYELTDFAILSSSRLGQFQLKRYRGELDTSSIFKSIKHNLAHYGNDLGDVNLLILLQTEGKDISVIDFHELNQQLIDCDFKSQGKILILYNEENKFDVINRIYPDVTTSRIPFELPSSQGV